MDKKYIYGTPRDCLICGKTFRPRDKGSAQKVCSNICRSKLQTQKAIRHCPVCQSTFLPTLATQATCSRTCGSQLRMSRRIPNPVAEIRKKMAQLCCGFVAKCLRNKTDATAEMLGYTGAELKAHLERQFGQEMSWDNYGHGAGKWSVDHIRPISSFSPETPISEINALSNLRPLWFIQNCAKNKKWEGQ